MDCASNLQRSGYVCCALKPATADVNSEGRERLEVAESDERQVSPPKATQESAPGSAGLPLPMSADPPRGEAATPANRVFAPQMESRRVIGALAILNTPSTLLTAFAYGGSD